MNVHTMDLIFIADSLDSVQPLLRVASRRQYRVSKLIGLKDEAGVYVESLRPDAVIFISDEIDRVVLKSMRDVSEKRPTPMLVFTSDSQQESIDSAVKAGATAYVVDCNDPERLGALLDVARVRFQELERVKKELIKTRNDLQERKRVEKAKGIIMKTKQLSEDQAYSAMRRLAMNHNKRMGEIAEQIISASEVLI
jgi:two-component system, response regulator / RNA-binding antiterminator